MKTIYTFLILVLVILVVAFVIVKVNNFLDRNKFYDFEQKCKAKKSTWQTTNNISLNQTTVSYRPR